MPEDFNLERIKNIALYIINEASSYTQKKCTFQKIHGIGNKYALIL